MPGRMLQGSVDMAPVSRIIHQDHPGNCDAAEDVKGDEAAGGRGGTRPR
jgi:hypothetical protein